ncbi:cilia- and flagella-associated protein 300 [Nematostella vectensis]|uniref:cilia- and flagella-associated protein 300 n=1 Tax=Nematostella vectensis TaxID=45351 RepID=UPI00207783E2|nr:cilia- and flagella-associated protein 300 [Nematostella vectensis]
MAEEKGAKFTFTHVPGKKFQGFESAEVQELLLKWGMDKRTCIQMYTYEQYFQAYEKDEFVKDFFEDQNVLSTLQVVSSTNTWGSLGIKGAKYEAEQVPCTSTSMDFFDKLYSEGIVRESGNIRKCFDEYFEDFIISDELRKVLLLEDSENYDIFSEEERSEFLFKILKHLCLGGQVCQYEDSVQPYMETARTLYKDLVSVYKDQKTKKLQIGSIILKIASMSEDSTVLYPSNDSHDQTFAYMCVDMAKRHIYIWYHSWKS